MPVFWAGLAVWLLFAVAPLRSLLGLVPRRRSTVTGGLPFSETLGGGQRRGLDDRYEAEVGASLPGGAGIEAKEVSAGCGSCLSA